VAEVILEILLAHQQAVLRDVVAKGLVVKTIVFPQEGTEWLRCNLCSFMMSLVMGPEVQLVLAPDDKISPPASTTWKLSATLADEPLIMTELDSQSTLA
jgi:hypothetical protein